MERNSGLSELIYEYYESRILFGTYRYGDQLMSIPQLRAAFRLGRNTVQAALARLEKNGYITTGERKVARVVYQGSEEAFQRHAAEYFVPRREGIIDFQYAGELLFMPLWEIGLHSLKLDCETGTYWNQNAVRKGLIPIPVKVYFDVLRTFHNELLLSLYWQCLRYLNFLYPKGEEKRLAHVSEELLSPDRISDLKREFDIYFDATQNEVLDFAEAAEKAYQLENVEQIPFRWTIYRQRPQVKYTLASAIIREILWERYPKGSYLPSLPRLAEQYKVSLSTVRRTLEVLKSLGVTRTYMGKGTKVCLEPADLDIMKVSEIRENLRLHGEGMQILALTVRGVTLFTLESAAKEKTAQLSEKIATLHGKSSGILCVDVLLSFISTECPSAILRECYDRLRELVAWGYILSAVLMRDGQLEDDFTDFLLQLETDLRDGSFAAFAERWQAFIENRLAFFYSKLPFKEGRQAIGLSQSIDEEI